MGLLVLSYCNVDLTAEGLLREHRNAIGIERMREFGNKIVVGVENLNKKR